MTGKKESVFDTRMVDELAAAETIDLEAEFEAIHVLKRLKTSTIAPIYNEIQELQLKLESASQPYDTSIESHMKYIENTVLLEGKTFKCPHGKATYRRESERSSWDNKALLGYAAAHPEIEQFRKVTPVKASVSISFEGDGQ